VASAELAGRTATARMLAMPFSPVVAERLLVASHRHCCICHKPSGSKMQIHHIVAEADGGDDSFENGIPLCLDCHAEVGSYNPRHPVGRRLSPTELRKHRDQWFKLAARPPWQAHAPVAFEGQSLATVAELLEAMPTVAPWKKGINEFLARVFALDTAELAHLVEALSEVLASQEDEDVRWTAATVVENLVSYNPWVISRELLERMSCDPSFSVRSCAAVAYYQLAGSAPNEVPLQALPGWLLGMRTGTCARPQQTRF
jgi:HNH endonuclease